MRIFRFSLASEFPLPKGLLEHTRYVLKRDAWLVHEDKPSIPGLHCVSFSGNLREGLDLSSLRQELRGPALALMVDCAFLLDSLATDGPRLIVSDVDSTFIHGEVIDMLAQAAGSGEEVAAITEAAMCGELDFAESLEKRVATLRGLEAHELHLLAKSVRPVQGAEALVRAAHARGAKVGLVSGGFHEVIDVLAADLSIDFVRANHLEVQGTQLTGRTVGPVVTREAKAEALLAWAQNMNISPLDVLAMGDGANDLSMMEIAGFSLGVCAKPVVVAQADAVITTPRLDILIALLGWDYPEKA